MIDFISTSDTPEWINDLPSEFHHRYLGLQVWQWLGILFLITVARIGMTVGIGIARRIMRSRDKSAPDAISKDTNRAVLRAAGLLTGVLFCYPFTGPINLPPKADHIMDMVLSAMTILAFASMTLAIWDAICDGMTNRAATVSHRAERLLVPLTRKFVRAIIVSIALMIVLSSLFHVNIMAVIASLGIGGVVVALAAKDSVENIIGSITLLFDMPFAIGDTVKIDKLEGVVEEINLRSTRIRTFEDSLINLPNANLIRASVENVSARRYRRQKMNVRISYDTPIEKINAFCENLRSALILNPRLDPDRVIVNFLEADDTAITILVQCHAEANTYAAELEIRHQILNEIVRARQTHGVLYQPLSVRKILG